MTELPPEKKAEIAKRFTEAIPHCKALGHGVDEDWRRRSFIEMPYDERFIGDPRTGVIHGGAVSALLDTCCGASVMSHPRAPAITATIDLRIDYMRPATPGQRIRAQATCYRVTKSVAFVRAVALDDDEDRPVATAAGTFTADHAPGRKSSEALS